MKAGEYQTVSVALQLGNTKAPADWSVVAWGEYDDVYVYNDDGTES